MCDHYNLLEKAWSRGGNVNATISDNDVEKNDLSKCNKDELQQHQTNVLLALDLYLD